MDQQQLHHEEVLASLDAMRIQEDRTHCTFNYLQTANKENIDESARQSMVMWCQQVQKALTLHPETVWLSVSFFDRYLSSGKGNSPDALQDRYQFQLAAITAFYTAVKVNESQVELSVQTLAKLCKGYYAVEDILEMEQDILFALDWRVATPTPMDFARHLAELLPSKVHARHSAEILECCSSSVYGTSNDMYFTFCKPSVVGASALASALTKLDLLTTQERSDFWLHLARITDLIDTMEAQSKLMTGKTVTQKPKKRPAAASVVAKCVPPKSSSAAQPAAKTVVRSSSNVSTATAATAATSKSSLSQKIAKFSSRREKTMMITSTASAAASSRRQKTVTRTRNSSIDRSPICVTQAARQA